MKRASIKNRFPGERIKKRCNNCGALHEVTKHTLPGRDEDSIDCLNCGAVLMRWKACVMYSMEKLIEMPESGRNN